MKNDAIKAKLKLILLLIQQRKLTAANELDKAIKNRLWSKTPGWDGIEIGLMMAEKIVKEELKGL